MTTHLTDDEAISEAMKGYYTGYSPSILPKSSADKYLAALKAGKECACKNMVNSSGNALIKDVPDGVVLSVSLTRQPCLHESKFCEIDNMEEDMSLKSKILDAMGMSEAAEVEALKSEVVDLKSAIDEMREALKSMQEEFKQTLTEALTPVEQDVVEVAEKAEDEAEPTEEEEDEVEVEEEDVAEKSEEEEIVEEVEEEVVAKAESKAAPVHDNLQAEKAKPRSIYAVLGRNPDGTRRL